MTNREFSQWLAGQQDNLRSISFPARVGAVPLVWGVEPPAPAASAGLVTLETPVEALAGDIQSDGTAAPFFLLCVAAWTGRSCRVTVTGSIASLEKNALLHFHRTTFLLREMESLLGGRFLVRYADDGTAAEAARWPKAPVLNGRPGLAPDLTEEEAVAAGFEKWLEACFTMESQLTGWFNASARLAGGASDVKRFDRQLPIGVFEGVVAAATAWTPRAHAAVDVFAPSEDGRTIHLLELKGPENVAVGILPEALYYLLLLSRVRQSAGVLAISGDSPSLQAIRAADQIAMWLVAPRLHPLITGRNAPDDAVALSANSAPLQMLREALAGRGLHLEYLGFPQEFVDERWPP